MQLGNNILSSLYKDNSLVKLKTAPEWSDLGKGAFAKRMLVIVKKSPNFTLELDFLAKVLLAVNYQLEKDTKYVVLSKDETFSLMSLAVKQEVSHLFIFGFDPSDFGLQMNLQAYDPILIRSMLIIKADSLSKIENDRELKIKLWNVLKEIFKT